MFDLAHCFRVKFTLGKGVIKIEAHDFCEEKREIFTIKWVVRSVLQ